MCERDTTTNLTFPIAQRHIIALVKMARPQMVGAGMLVYALGVIMGVRATQAMHWPAAAAGLIVLLAANLCAHYADEYADRDVDALSRHTWFSGGSGVLPSGMVKPALALHAAVIAGAIAVGAAALFGVIGLLTVAALTISALGLIGGWCYSMPPLALERRGLGEAVNTALGALLIPLLGFTTQAGTPSVQAALALLPVCAITLANLLGVHWTDRRADAAVGKRTLVIRLGGQVLSLHRALVGLTYGLTWLFAGAVLPIVVVAAITLTLPLSVWATLTFTRAERHAASSIAMVALMSAACAGWLLV